MRRSLWAVILGTFTLRFSTGLTGALLRYYLAKLPQHGGEEVSPITNGILLALFFVAELCSPPCWGARRGSSQAHRSARCLNRSVKVPGGGPHLLSVPGAVPWHRLRPSVARP